MLLRTELAVAEPILAVPGPPNQVRQFARLDVRGKLPARLSCYPLPCASHCRTTRTPTTTQSPSPLSPPLRAPQGAAAAVGVGLATASRPASRRGYVTMETTGDGIEASLVALAVRDVRLLGGRTGSGKTEVLQALAQLEGGAAIDLEGLANHRGSAFGGIGLGPQPTQLAFEEGLLAVRQTV